MWRLFPKAWFSTQPRNKETIAVETAAEHLRVRWRAFLAAGMADVLARADLSEEASIAMLPSLASEDLLTLDGVMRHRWRFHSPTVSDASPPSVTPIGDVTESAAYLFLASCHGNGFIRERALIAFEHYPGRLALVAALIRCDDWVKPVRQAALSLFGKLLQSDCAPVIFDELSLVTRLRGRIRTGSEVWPDYIEPALRAARFRIERWRCTDAPNPDARKLAYELVLESDLDRALEALQKACNDLHPKVALWGQANLARVDEVMQQNLLRQAIRHPRAMVRGAALREYASMSPAGLRGDLEAAIFDESRGVRDAAAYLLEQLFQVSARTMWRIAIDLRDSDRLIPAFAALSSVAQLEDVDRIAAFLSNSSARIRVLALRGVVHSKAPQAENYLQRALTDPSGLVVRSALSLLSKEGQPLRREDLEQAFVAAQNDRVRRQLIRGSRLLGKWDELLFLIPLLSAADALVAGEGIDRWLLQANRRFTSLDATTKATIGARLAEVNGPQRDRRWAALNQLLRQS